MRGHGLREPHVDPVHEPDAPAVVDDAIDLDEVASHQAIAVARVVALLLAAEDAQGPRVLGPTPKP